MGRLAIRMAVFLHVLLCFVQLERLLMVVSAHLYKCEVCFASDQENLVHAFVNFDLMMAIVLC